MKIKGISNGWVKMHVDDEAKAAIKKAGVWPDKMKDHFSKVWVPRWIRDGIKLYRKGDGFAGLTLDEFLASIRPVNDENDQNGPPTAD